MWLSRVVLPAPRKPVRIVTGRPLGADSRVGAWALGLALVLGLLMGLDACPSNGRAGSGSSLALERAPLLASADGAPADRDPLGGLLITAAPQAFADDTGIGDGGGW